jgi:hypothetical protein
VGSILLLLAACQGGPLQLTGGAATTPEALAEPQGPQEDPTQDPINDAHQNAPRPEVANLAPPPPVADTSRLMGLDQTALARLLGDPDLKRREPPAEVWQFRGDTCVFDVFLYPEAGQPRVTYLEARDDLARQVDAGRCLGALLWARGREPLG